MFYNKYFIVQRQKQKCERKLHLFFQQKQNICFVVKKEKKSRFFVNKKTKKNVGKN